MAQFTVPLMIASTVLTATSQAREGAGARDAKYYQASQADQEAGQSRASAQRDAIEQRRRADLLASHLQAQAGGGGLDPTVTNLAANIAGEGEYRALSSLYGGEERARGLEGFADARRYEGDQARQAGGIKALTTVLSSAGSLYQKFNVPSNPGTSSPGDGLTQGERRRIGVW